MLAGQPRVFIHRPRGAINPGKQVFREMHDAFIGRQPILDKDQALVGYELLFRATTDNNAAPANGAVATADVVCKAFAELGLAKVLDHVLTFIKVDAEFLAADFIEILPSRCVVLEIDADQFLHGPAQERCRELRKLGYAFCLSGLTEIDDGCWPLIDIAAWIKVGLGDIPHERLQTIARTLATTHRRLIAAQVETQSQQELCRLLGFDLFQGYFFARPVVIEGRKLDPSTQGLLRLIKLLADEAETGKLEEAFRQEPALVINLLRLVNSVGAGMRAHITSIRHAITAIGRTQLKRWLHLLIFAQNGQLDFARNPLLQLAALRGRFMELLVDRLHAGDTRLRDAAFLTGLMSVVPAALRMSMTEVLDQIAVDPEVRSALAGKQGHLGAMLAITESYDDCDLAAVQALIAPFGNRASVSMLGEVLAEALPWVQQLGIASPQA